MKKLIAGIIIGIVLTLSINIVGASIESSGVMYNSKTLNTVLDDLYSKIEEINNTGDASASDILIGKTALVKGTKVTGTMIDRGTNQTTEGFGCFPSGCGSGDSQYYAFNDIPEGYYHKDGYSWAPEIRVNANKFRSALGISADKIAPGQSIAGITGTYTSDANASASNILSGKTAYVNGTKITGTMTNKSGTTTAATTITESGSNALITIPTNGYYTTSSKISVPISTIKNNVSSLNVSSIKNVSAISNGGSCPSNGFVAYNLTTQKKYYETAANSTTITTGIKVGDTDYVIEKEVYNAHYFTYSSKQLVGYKNCNSGDVISVYTDGTGGVSISLMFIS